MTSLGCIYLAPSYELDIALIKAPRGSKRAS